LTPQPGVSYRIPQLRGIYDQNFFGATGTPICPVTRHSRLSYRRAAELFEQATQPLANPSITDRAERARRGGWSLHQLRHSALTHEAEDGTNTPTLLQRSRHASVRSLERYARPSVDAVARHVAQRDPLARHRTGRTQ
jgi:integrase/recombinase XerD